MSRHKKGKKVDLDELAGANSAAAVAQPHPPDEGEAPLFPESHKEQVAFILENYEKNLNDSIQHTLDAIAKKKDDLEALQAELVRVRQARAFVRDEFPGTEEAPARDPEAKVSEKEVVEPPML